MKLIYQDYPKECGICILSMIHNYLYDKKISKELVSFELINNTSEITLKDFECYSLYLGFESKSYKIPFQKFLEIKFKDYFVSCIKKGVFLHYVICKKEENHIILYDPEKGKNKISFSDFEKIYSEIIIIFKKNENQKINFIDLNNIGSKFSLTINRKFLIIFFLLDLLLLICTLVSSIFIKVFISDIFPNKNVNSLIFSVLFFGLLYFFNFILNILIKNYKFYHFSNIFKKNFYLYTQIIKYKSKLFFKAFDKKIIYEYLNFISIKIEEKNFLIPTIVFNCLSILSFFIVISFISSYFIFIILVYLIVSIVIFFIKKNNNSKYFEKLELSNNFITSLLNNFYSFVEEEKNIVKSKSIISNLQKETRNNFFINKNKIFKESIIKSFIDFFDKFIFLLLAILSCFLFFNLNKNLEVSSILLTFSLMTYINSSTTNLLDFLSKIPIYKKAGKYLLDLENQFNINFNNSNLEVNSFKEVELANVYYKYNYSHKNIFENLNLKIFNDSFIIGKNGIGKTTLLRILSLDYEPEKGNIFFNKINLLNINKKILYHNIIFQSSDSTKTNIDFSYILNINDDIREKIIQLIKKLNINIGNLESNTFSKGETQILNFLSLLEQKNKFILLDESLSNVDDEMADHLLKNFKNYIIENNFLIFVSHNKKFQKHFKNHLRL